jgi:hypothetical protein
MRVARALGQLPQLSEAMRRVELSFAKVRATTSVATPANEENLLELARQGTASHIEKIVRAWRRVDRLEERLRFCDAHHVKHWADGGVTCLENLVLSCRRHHRAVHEEGFQVMQSEDGEFRFFRPDGRPLLATPPTPRLPADPTATLKAAHRAQALEIDASTAMSGWMGERLDLDYAVLTLRGPK